MSKFVHVLLVLLLAAPAVHAGADDICSCALPATIDVPADLRRYLQVMLRQSATFRRQCRRLAVPGLLIRIRPDLQLFDRPFRARSVIQRSERGALLASVAITPFGDPTEWLAHELEHVIEQLDGIRLPQLVAEGDGAWRTGENMFETARARRVGRLVVHEVHDGRRSQADAAAALEAGARGD